jgi:hypothetical protein
MAGRNSKKRLGFLGIVEQMRDENQRPDLDRGVNTWTPGIQLQPAGNTVRVWTGSGFQRAFFPSAQGAVNILQGRMTNTVFPIRALGGGWEQLATAT